MRNATLEDSRHRAVLQTLMTRHRREGFRLPALVGGVLLLAAVLKCHQLVIAPAEANYILGSRWLTIALVEFELALALLLLTGLFRMTVRRIAIGAFSVFAVVSLLKAVSGEQSCTCFGGLDVHPWGALAIDVAAIALLALWRPARRSSVRRAPVLCCLMAILLVVPMALNSVEFRSLSDQGEIVGNGSIIVLEPEDWIGQRLPIAKFIENSSRLMEGEWTLVLYHESCPVCQKLIRDALAGTSGAQDAFVEVPPYRSPPRSNRQNLLWLRLDDAHDWFVEAPTAIVLHDGLVRTVLPRTDL